MRKFKSAMLVFFLVLSTGMYAQETEAPKEEVREMGHTNQNKFKQLYEEFSTPNQFRSASGAPGAAYYQNQADYKMDIELNDKTQRLSGVETITYHNNSPDELEYLWVQLDQNIRTKNSAALEKNGSGISAVNQAATFTNQFLDEPFDGGFIIESVTKDGKTLPHSINFTMMRLDLPKPLKAGESTSFTIKWSYNINNHVTDRARSGYEHFPEDGVRKKRYSM